MPPRTSSARVKSAAHHTSMISHWTFVALWCLTRTWFFCIRDSCPAAGHDSSEVMRPLMSLLSWRVEATCSSSTVWFCWFVVGSMLLSDWEWRVEIRCTFVSNSRRSSWMSAICRSPRAKRQGALGSVLGGDSIEGADAPPAGTQTCRSRPP